MGASLLAKAVCQSDHLSTDTTHSRAGSLPQGFAEFFIGPTQASPESARTVAEYPGWSVA
ncbi:hypothetical protein EVS84_21110 [Pseudomonas koreensis]|uniref:Uncharacterized protein n=1 Tax=Pseudomonas koreensis TaxID=198620 RepID=A0A4V1WH33_9PSED|nr:hypothetical protein EVS84_21110 [Pseudomonas koreensis]